MFNIGPGELIIIALVLLIAVGPEQLPGLIRRIGQVVGQARDMTDSLRSEFMSGMEELERTTDPNAWAASAGPSPDRPQPAIPGVDKPAKPLDADDSSDPSDLADPADDEDPVDLRDPVEPVDSSDSGDAVEPSDLSGPVDSGDPADSGELMDQVDPVDPAGPSGPADSGDPVDSIDDEYGASETDSSPKATTGTWGPLEAGPAQAEPSRPSDAVAPAVSDDNGSGNGNEIPGGDHRGNGAEPVNPVDGDDNPKLEESA